MDELKRDIEYEVPWCMSFSDDIVLVDESRAKIIPKLERWRKALDTREFGISRTEIEYTECNLVTIGQQMNIVKLEGQVEPKRDIFRYLCLIVHWERDITKDVTHISRQVGSSGVVRLVCCVTNVHLSDPMLTFSFDWVVIALSSACPEWRRRVGWLSSL